MGDHRARSAPGPAATGAALTDRPPSPRKAATVRVAVDAVTDRPERAFDYVVPPDSEIPEPGSLLLVPYGARLALGYALESPEPSSAATGVDGARDPDALRTLESIVSPPMLRPDLLRLAERMASYYRAPLGMTISGILPAGLESRLVRRWTVTDATRLPERLRASVEDDGTLSEDALRRAIGSAARVRTIERLRREGVVRAAWTLRRPEARRLRERMIRAAGGVAAARLRGSLQRELAAAVGPEARPLADVASELRRDPASLLAPARAMEAMGLVELGWRDVVRDPVAHRVQRARDRHPPATEQHEASRAIDRSAPGSETLLVGVAASGKTDVYLEAAEGSVAGGRGVILLVPEISLVTQLVDTVRSRFGEEVAVLHSGLSPGERHDTWWRILDGRARVVVGTRMAVFAPLADIGLIVVDEEHDGGYKQDRTPRYDARWVARQRAADSGARLVLASATPDVVTYDRARRQERVVRLLERRTGTPPSVELVDMRAELAEGERSIFSRALRAALAEMRPNVEQAILLINRRGASTFILCRDCGHAMRCPVCDLPLVFHLDGDVLRCHHCGRIEAVPSVCPACGGLRIRYFGAGTQRVEAELRRVLPSLRVARLDSDAIARRRGHEAVYDDFREGRVDVLVGTQMVAKGLDLPNVTVVGVVAADVTLNLPDFRAAERTFQLVAQVAGRAGRGPRAGRVVVQTYAPEHYALRAAARLDLDGFANEELPRRRLLGYPPATVLARLTLSDADRVRAEKRAVAARDAVAVAGVEVFGPVPAYVPRRAGRWWLHVVVRAADADARGEALEHVPQGVSVDVDPESLL